MISGRKLSRRHALLAGAAAPLVALTARPAVAKAEMMGMATPGFSRFKHGDFEVTTLLAGTRPVPNPHTIFGLNAEEQKWLQAVPYKGSLPTAVPTDPLIYRFYELINVYGTTFKELIHEEFGDGIMSAIDFKMDLKREKNPAGDRVNIVMSGKFLPYKQY